MFVGSGTTAVPTELIDDGVDKRRALCPACHGGVLHPYEVTVPLGGFAGQDVGIGWVAICVGAKNGERRSDGRDAQPCGFSLPLAAYHHVPHAGLRAQYPTP